MISNSDKLKIKIVSDSSCDIKSVDGVDFTSVPLTLSPGDRDFVDNEALNVREMLDVLEKHNGRSHTACPSVDRWISAFEGADIVYAVTMTSNLSGTYNSACAARDIYMQTHPDVKIHIFDSLSTGPEMRLLIERIAKLIGEGEGFEKIIEIGQRYLDSVKLFFVLGSLHNLSQNGRVNKNVASVIKKLGVRMIGMASEIGTIKVVGACKGAKKVPAAIIKKLKASKYNGKKLYVCHVEGYPLADELRREIKKEYPEAEILVYPAGGLCSFYAERGGMIIGFECEE